MSVKAYIFPVVGLILLASLLLYRSGLSKQAKTLTLALGGDTMLGRLVNEVVTVRGYRYPWGNLLSLLKKHDLRLINLETTLTNSTQMVPKVFNFKATPDKVQVLREAHIDVVNIANNHILDFGIPGLKETIATLDAAGIKHVGAGDTITLAKKPVILEKNGIKIGILGFTDNEPDWLAGPETPGVNYLEVGDTQAIVPNIQQLRPQVDILIVSCQWGPNMRLRPTQQFKAFAHALIDAGVDIIHGHSAHIFQGVETYKNGLILYDTGDLIDDYAVDPALRNDQSFLFSVTLTKAGVQKLELIPIIIGDMQVNLAAGEEKAALLEKMRVLSAELGTNIEDGVVELK